MTGDPLHRDAVRVLTGWAPESERDRANRQRALDLLTAGPDTLRRGHAPGHVTSSAVVVHADRERVLLCLHGRFHQWCQVGGHCEDGDTTLAGAALREATEESGIAGLRVDPVLIGFDIHPVTCSGGPSHHFDARFAVLAPPGAVEAVSEESDALGWFRLDALPSPLASATEEVLAPALARFAR